MIRITHKFYLVFIAALMCILPASSSIHAFEPKINTSIGCVFANSKATFAVGFLNGKPGPSSTVRVYGFLNIANRTVARNDVAISQADGAHAILTLEIPSVKESLIIPAELELIARNNEDGTVVTRGKEPVFIFHADPFAGRRDVLEQLPIRVFDPHGQVVKAFSDKNAPVPFREIFNPQQIASVSDGVLVIGFGTTTNELMKKTLIKQAATAAENGALVLCLEFPKSMQTLPGMTFPDSDTSIEAPEIKRIRLEKPGVVKSFDKRFDPLYPLRETRRAHGWAWYEAEYNSGGRLIVTNIPIIQNWHHSPVPRYLFLELVTR